MIGEYHELFGRLGLSEAGEGKVKDIDGNEYSVIALSNNGVKASATVSDSRGKIKTIKEA